MSAIKIKEGSNWVKLQHYGIKQFDDAPSDGKSYVRNNQLWQELPDCLSKSNTAEYTPSSDYNPSTKKYVDDTLSTKEGELRSNINTVSGNVSTLTDTVNTKAGKTLIKNVSSSSLTLSPNIYYIWGTMSSLAITIPSQTTSNNTELGIYAFQFTSGSTATSLTLKGASWITGFSPMIAANKVYQVTVVNGFAAIGGK